MRYFDPKLNTFHRVRGIQRLRVVDASVMPRTTNANINASVMLVAEKAAQDILKYYSIFGGGPTAIPF